MRERAVELGRKCGYPDITNRDQSKRLAAWHGLEPMHAVRCAKAAIFDRLRVEFPASTPHLRCEALNMSPITCDSEEFEQGTIEVDDYLSTVGA